MQQFWCMSRFLLNDLSAAQLVAALAWVAVICHDSRQQDVVAAADGGRQLQSSWRAMERLELWFVPHSQHSDQTVCQRTVTSCRDIQPPSLASCMQLT